MANAWEWRVEVMFPFDVAYGGAIPESLPVALQAIMREAQADCVAHLYPCRKESRESRTVRMKGAIALLPRSGANARNFFEIEKQIPSLTGFAPADVYDLSAWLARSSRKAASPNLLFAPGTYTQTGQGNAEVLCAARKEGAKLFTYHFLSVTRSQYHNDYEYCHVCDVSIRDHSGRIFKPGTVVGVLYVKPL